MDEKEVLLIYSPADYADKRRLFYVYLKKHADELNIRHLDRRKEWRDLSFLDTDFSISQATVEMTVLQSFHGKHK